jgi:hypothetical protein
MTNQLELDGLIIIGEQLLFRHSLSINKLTYLFIRQRLTYLSTFESDFKSCIGYNNSSYYNAK